MDAITKEHLLSEMKIHAANTFPHFLNEKRGYAKTRRANLFAHVVEQVVNDFQEHVQDMVHELSDENEFNEHLRSLIPPEKETE